MTKYILGFLILFSFAGYAADWASSSFIHPQILKVSEASPPRGTDLVLRMTVVVFRNSLWTQDSVLAHWKRTSEILEPCGIAVQVGEFVETELPNKIENIYAPNDQEIAGLLPQDAARPVAFFASGDIIQTFLDEFTSNSPRRSLIGTVWVGDVATTAAYRSRIRPEYEVVAHEIGHLLGFEGHVMGPVNNLMSGEPGYGSASLTADQCQLLRTSVYLKPLKPVGF